MLSCVLGAVCIERRSGGMLHSGMQHVRAQREERVRGKVAKCKVWLVGGVVLSFSARCQPLLQCTGLPNVQAAALHRVWVLIHPFMDFCLANPICHPPYSELLLHQAQRVRA